MNNKYAIIYPLIVLSYNVYYKAMTGLDKNFLPKELCQSNVSNLIQSKLYTNNYLIGLQEAEAFKYIIPKNISKENYVIGRSGNEKMVTIWSNNFILIKSHTTDFHSGRPIQLSLLRNYNDNYLFLNIHAPHDYQNFGNYNGKLKVNNNLYSKEIIKILNDKINIFLKNYSFEIDRIIIIGDFNEYLKDNFVNSFVINLKNKIFNMHTDLNRVETCCLFLGYSKPCDYIFDSKYIPKINISSFAFPASDHFPIETII